MILAINFKEEIKMIGDGYYKEISNSEFKMARFLNKFASLASELCSYLSYKTEVCNDIHTISIKINGEEYYKDWYRDLCNRMGIDIDVLAKEFNFPKTVIIEISNYDFPYATIHAYFGEDECEITEYKFDLPGSNDTLESMIQDIKDYWRV